MRGKITALVLVLTLLSAPLVAGAAAQSGPPQPPMSLYGDVTINGNSDASGYTIVAVDGTGTEVGNIEIKSGSYGGSGPYDSKLNVDCGCDTGDTIRFMIDGTQAEQTVAFVSGDVQRQDLTFNSVATPTPTPTSSGGGGGGGGAPPADTPVPENTPIPDNTSTVVQIPIEDKEPQVPGTTVNASESDVVQEVTFGEAVNGTLEISETNIDENDTADIAAQFDETASGDPKVVKAVDISPDSEAVAETAATIKLSVPREGVNDPTAVFVAHQAENGWERLDVIERQISEDGVTVVAEAESFSAFAVVEVESATTPTPQAGTATGDETTPDDATQSTASLTGTVPPDAGGDQQPGTAPNGEAGGFGILPLLGLVAAVVGVVVALAVLRRNDRQ